MKKALTIAAIVLVLAFAGAFIYLKGKRYEIVIPQEKIDASLAKRFPASKSYLLIFTITYSNPQVTLLPGENRVQVGLDATLDLRLTDESKNLGGGATVTAGVRYDNENQEFYLDKAHFDRLEIQGVPEELLEKVTEYASKTAREFIETKPIYRLEAKDAKTTAVKMLLKDFEVREQAIYVTLGI